MRFSSLLRVIHPLASSYVSTAMVGCIVGGVVSSAAAASDPGLAYRYLLTGLLVGAIGGCLLTYTARRLLDLLFRTFELPALHMEPLGIKTKAIAATMAFVFVAGGLVTLVAADLEPTAARGKCYVSRLC